MDENHAVNGPQIHHTYQVLCILFSGFARIIPLKKMVATHCIFWNRQREKTQSRKESKHVQEVGTGNKRFKRKYKKPWRQFRGWCLFYSIFLGVYPLFTTRWPHIKSSPIRASPLLELIFGDSRTSRNCFWYLLTDLSPLRGAPTGGIGSPQTKIRKLAPNPAWKKIKFTYMLQPCGLHAMHPRRIRHVVWSACHASTSN